MGKRAAAKSSSAPDKRARVAKVVDPKLADYRNITKGLKMDRELPNAVQEMLTEMMPGCLGEDKENRHAIQHSMIEIYESILGNIEKSQHKDIADIDVQIGGLGDEKIKREAAVQEAEADKAKKEKDCEAKKCALADAARRFQTAKNALFSAQEEQRKGDKEAGLAGARLGELQAALAEMVEPLAAGTLAPEEAPRTISSLVQTLTVYDFDKSLLTSIPNAMGKAPDQRGQFDAVVVDQVKTEALKRITSFSQIVESAEPEKRARADKVARAENELAAAREKQNASADDFTGAQSAKAESEQHLEAKHLDLVRFETESNKLHKKRDTLQNRLKAFQECQLGSLRKLVALTSEPVESVESAEPAEPASVASV